MRNNSSNEEAVDAFLRQFEEAVKSGRWMAAVWSIGENGNVPQTQRTTFNYPKNCFQISLDMLRHLLEIENDAKAESKIPPLPLAPHVRTSDPDEQLPKYDKSAQKNTFSMTPVADSDLPIEKYPTDESGLDSVKKDSIVPETEYPVDNLPHE